MDDTQIVDVVVKKENQSLLDFLQTTPLANFLTRRPSISSTEAQVLYDIWKQGNTNEYGRHVLDNSVDPIQIATLTTKGYVRNIPTHLGSDTLLEFTDKGKELIKKIILNKEKSAFEKESQDDDPFIKKASSNYRVANNWLGKSLA